LKTTPNSKAIYPARINQNAKGSRDGRRSPPKSPVKTRTRLTQIVLDEGAEKR
jgi:hypothetical protein